MTRFVNINDWAKHKSETNEALKKKGHELVEERDYKDFDEMVDNNSESWRGIEYLDSVLSYCQTMRDESLPLESRLRKAYDQFQDEDHSGRTAHMTLGAIRRFCFEGHRLADEIEDFKYDPNGSLSERRERERWMRPIKEREMKIRENEMNHRYVDTYVTMGYGKWDEHKIYTTNGGMFRVELPYGEGLEKSLKTLKEISERFGLCYAMFNSFPLFSFDTEERAFMRKENGMTKADHAELMEALRHDPKNGKEMDLELAYKILKERTWKHLGKK